MDVSLTRSSPRVAPRSVIRAAPISATIASSVSASDSTAAVRFASPIVRKRTFLRSECSPSRFGVNSLTMYSIPSRLMTSRSSAK